MESKYCLTLLRFFYLQELLFTKLRFNESPYNELLGITNDIRRPSNSKMRGKESRYSMTKDRQREPILALRKGLVKLGNIVFCYVSRDD